MAIAFPTAIPSTDHKESRQSRKRTSGWTIGRNSLCAGKRQFVNSWRFERGAGGKISRVVLEAGFWWAFSVGLMWEIYTGGGPRIVEAKCSRKRSFAKKRQIHFWRRNGSAAGRDRAAIAGERGRSIDTQSTQIQERER